MPTIVPKEGEPIPSVDPEDLKGRWNIKPPWTAETLQAATSHEVNSAAVSRRDGMIRILANFNDGQLLAPWRHGEELDDAVFRVAATFPMRAVRRGVYKIAGDDIFGVDPNTARTNAKQSVMPEKCFGMFGPSISIPNRIRGMTKRRIHTYWRYCLPTS
jgi:hypothetical protein